MKLTPIHPFPARMAPEIAIDELARCSSSKTVMDPMSGSGTVLRAAAELGHFGFGFDLDPLAVLMARVWTSRIQVARVLKAGDDLVAQAKHARDVYLPWIDECEETKAYIQFWFCSKQEKALRRLAFCLNQHSGVTADALRVALSRIIITKERGASIARDTSHSRPHRVFFNNDFDVYRGFLQSVRQLASRLHPAKLLSTASVRYGDSRRLDEVPAASVDLVITSPPYLNAIDYLRGHRLSLVWLGYGASEIRKLRFNSIGAERAASEELSNSTVDALLNGCGDIDALPARHRGMVRRYAQDVSGFMLQLARTLKKDGRALLVVGNSCLKGVSISNADINVSAAAAAGLRMVSRCDRNLPNSSRYLPLPDNGIAGGLSGRMRTETLLTFCPASPSS
jgi:DNA modification methylase